jgi:signal transduction histidine kinase/CheY-like chemotaxis protein
VLDRTTELVSFYDLQARVLWANRAVCSVARATLHELAGRVLWEQFPDLVGSEIHRAFVHVAATGEMQEVVHRSRRLDAWFATSLTRQAGVICVLSRDVSAERETRRHLVDVADGARASDRRKSEFLAMLGHELRNPLAPITAAVSLLRMRGAGAGYARELEIIERQLGHVTRMVDDLLDVSRITSGHIALRRDTVDLARVVDAALEATAHRLEARGHELALHVPAAGLWVTGDEVRLTQVVVNLLCNAATYTPAGGRIEVMARAARGQVVLLVRDNGPGIPPEVLPRIFDLFVQGPRSLERGEGGLGLGLPIVRSLVALHGGTVDVSTAVGRGTDLVVSLPMAARAETPAVAAAPVPGLAPGAGRRVLVVDDNRDAAELLADGLALLGHHVTLADDGPSALRAAERFAPEVAVVDIGLPGMDGWELGRRLRELPGLGRVRLIAVTGYGQASDRLRSRAAGFDEHLVKPVELGRLNEAVVSPASGLASATRRM